MERDTNASKHDRETPIYGFTEKLLAYLWFCFIAAALIYPILNGSTVQEIMSLLNDGGFPLVAFILGPPFILLYRRDLGNFVQTYRNATTIADDIEGLRKSIKEIGEEVREEIGEHLKKDLYAIARGTIEGVGESIKGIGEEVRKEIGERLKEDLSAIVRDTSTQVKTQISDELQNRLKNQVTEFSGGVNESVGHLLNSMQMRIEDALRKSVDQISKSVAVDEEIEVSDADSNDEQTIAELRNKYYSISDTAVNIFNPLHSAIYLKSDDGEFPLVSRGGGNRKDITRDFRNLFVDELVSASSEKVSISREEAERIVGFMTEVFKAFGVRTRTKVSELKSIVEKLEMKQEQISQELMKAQKAVSSSHTQRDASDL